MKKLSFVLAIAAAFAWYSTTQAGEIAPTRSFVYKGTIKASKTLFDVNDTNNLHSETIKGYCVMTSSLLPPPWLGFVSGSSSVIYDSRNKCYKTIHYEIQTDLYDPCHVVLYHFETADDDGEFWFDVVGKGRPDPGSGPFTTFTPVTLKGTGFVRNFKFFNPDIAYTGPVTVTLTLSPKWMRYHGDTGNSEGIAEGMLINAIKDEMKSRGWTEWPDLTPP